MHISAEDLLATLRLDLFATGWKDAGYYPGISQRQVAMNALEASFLKKFHNDETDKIRDNKAIALFLECNERCRNFGGVLPSNLKDTLIIGEMKSILYDFFNPVYRDEVGVESRQPLLLNLSDISTHLALGNGSNIGASSTDFYTKYVNSTMAHTNPVLPHLFRQAISVDRIWTEIELCRSGDLGYELVSGSRLSCVPKSRIISRTICTEPLLNMFFQKGIAGVLEGRLREVFSVDLSSQPEKNAALARIGSTSGRYGTIDLSSASDSIATSMLREMLPKEPMDWLLRCRSPSTILPDGTEVDLHMISSMGNGYTFPLQTILFASLVKAAYRVLDIPIEFPRGQSLGNFAVFGDDIIVDSRVYNSVVSCLNVLGFSVNLDKSFNEGLFRESCGSDFYSGYNVRGVYIKTLNTSGDFYSAINRLIRWSTVHGIFLSRTIKLLRRGCRFRGVPFDEADDAGIKVPLSVLRSYRRDCNGAIKYIALVNSRRFVRLPNVESDTPIGSVDLSEVRRILPNFTYSSAGLLFCLLAGWIGNGSLGLRSLKPKAVLRRRVCPGWDERIAGPGVTPVFRSNWKVVAELSLVS